MCGKGAKTQLKQKRISIELLQHGDDCAGSIAQHADVSTTAAGYTTQLRQHNWSTEMLATCGTQLPAQLQHEDYSTKAALRR